MPMIETVIVEQLRRASVSGKNVKIRYGWPKQKKQDVILKSGAGIGTKSVCGWVVDDPGTHNEIPFQLILSVFLV